MKKLKIVLIGLGVLGTAVAVVLFLGVKGMVSDRTLSTKNQQTVMLETSDDKYDVVLGKRPLPLLYPEMSSDEALKKMIQTLYASRIQAAVEKIKKRQEIIRIIGAVQSVHPLNADNHTFESFRDLDGEAFLQLRGAKKTLPVWLEFSDNYLLLTYAAKGEIQQIELDKTSEAQ